MQNIKKGELFSCESLNQTLDIQVVLAILDYTKYGISVENPLLIKAYMKSRYRGKHHHIFVLMNKAKIGQDSVTEYYCTCKSGRFELSAVAITLWQLGDSLDMANIMG